jgi:hypothetical protein
VGRLEEGVIKWRLMLTTLPYVAVALAVKLGLEHLVGYTGAVEFTDVGMVLTGGVFLIGFMLAGTMADFKESEKLPADVACTLEAIEETFAQAAVGRASLDLPPYRRTLYQTTVVIDDWLHKRATSEAMFASLTRLGEQISELETVGAGPHASRALRDLAALRRLVTRIGVISRTGFLASGYALLEVLTIAIIGLLMISRFKNPITEVTLVSFVTLIYTYMVRLIRDIDDPFEYHAGRTHGAAEVELFPLDEYRTRLADRLKDPPARAAVG